MLPWNLRNDRKSYELTGFVQTFKSIQIPSQESNICDMFGFIVYYDFTILSKMGVRLVI